MKKYTTEQIEKAFIQWNKDYNNGEGDKMTQEEADEYSPEELAKLQLADLVEYIEKA